MSAIDPNNDTAAPWWVVVTNLPQPKGSKFYSGAPSREAAESLAAQASEAEILRVRNAGSISANVALALRAAGLDQQYGYQAVPRQEVPNEQP